MWTDDIEFIFVRVALDGHYFCLEAIDYSAFTRMSAVGGVQPRNVDSPHSYFPVRDLKRGQAGNVTDRGHLRMRVTQ